MLGNHCGVQNHGTVLDVVHRGNRLLSILFVRVAHEPKSSAATSIAVLNDDLKRKNKASLDYSPHPLDTPSGSLAADGYVD